jgi:L-rhamnose-H+ transport protein
MPALAAYCTVPSLGAVYAQAGLRSILLVAACGFGWGIAQVLFGLAVDSIGIALAFAIVLGLSAAIGSLIPFIRLHSEKVFTPAGLGVIGGVLLVVLGVSICAVAGVRRERALSASAGRGASLAGLLFAIVSGVGAAAMNFGVAFAGPLLTSASLHGADSAWSMNAVWLPLMMAGALPNLFYCVYRMRTRGTACKFSVEATRHYWLLAGVMAFFWFASTLMYGVASGKLGALGPVYGWPFFMSLIVIVASILGVLAGEWKDAGETPLALQFSGVSVLTAAVVVLSYAGRHL